MRWKVRARAGVLSVDMPRASSALLSSFALMMVACAAPVPMPEAISIDAEPKPAAASPASRPDPQRFAVGRFGFVEDIEGRPVLLLADDVPIEWGAGKPSLLSQPDKELRIARTGASSEVPGTHRVAGQEVDLYDGSTKVGSVVLGELWVTSMAFDFQSSDAPARPDAEVAAETFTTGQRWLVADIQGEIPKGASWGRLSAFSAPDIPTLADPGSELTSRALTQLEQEPAFVEAQERFESHYRSVNQPKPKDRWEDTGDVTVTSFTHRGRTFVIARIEAGEACWFNVIVGRVYEVSGDRLVAVEGAESYEHVELLVDVDEDGALEAVSSPPYSGGTALGRFIGAEQLLSEERPDWGCPC